MARQRGKTWQADVYVGTKRLRPTFKTKAEAEDFERNAVSMVDTSNVGTIFPQFAIELWEGKKSWRDAHRITNEWVKRLGPETPVHAVTEAKIDTIIASLKAQGNARQTINNKLTRLSKILKRCHRKKLIPSVPFIELKNGYSGRIRFLTPEEEQAIFSHLSPEHYHFARFLLYTGCRVGEAFALQWRDLSDNLVTFWVTKGDKARTVPMTTPAVQALEFMRGSSMRNVVNKPFDTIAYTTFLKAWWAAVKVAGLGDDPQCVPHVLRHTCCSRLVQRGVDIRRVKDWMGHANIQTTMRYAHLAPKDLEEVAYVLEQDVNPVTKPVTVVTKTAV